MRVWVGITAAEAGTYRVEVRADSASGPEIAPAHSMRALSAPPWVAPGAGDPPEEAALATLAEAVGLVANGEKRRSLVAELGRHLFESLLGEEPWRRIKEAAVEGGTREIELALSWLDTEHRLHSPIWEAMHDGGRFLAMHDQLTVAITRVLPARSDADADTVRRPGEREPVPAPARVLFVVATEFRDANIQTGVDVLGVLRGAEQGPSGIAPRILEAPNIEAVREACATFEPHIVHIVSHGEVTEAGGGRLILHGQGEFDEEERVDADALYAALTPTSGVPRVVALTGCHSAANGEHLDPLAAELVRRGIPIALGMAGRIADRASRLFVRRFGIAITQGEPLVKALTHGRRAGLLRQAAQAEDDPAWALPSIYLDTDVDAAASVVDGQNPSPGPARITEYELDLDPVLCGRQDVIGLFEQLLDRSDPLNNAVVFTMHEGKLGKTRLLHEFAARSLRRGHLVVMVKDRGTDISRRPRNEGEFALGMVEAMHHARKSFDLEVDDGSALVREMARLSGVPLDLTDAPTRLARLGRLQQWIDQRSREVADGSWPDLSAVLQNALAEDLERLARDTRVAHPKEFGADHRVMVVLGGIGEWGEATDLLCQTLLSTYGFGTKEEPVPVFATGTMVGAAEMLGRGRVRAEPLEAIEYLELARLEGPEEIIAYKTVLLHPSKKRPEDHEPISAYVPNFEKKKWEDHLRRIFRGVPANFTLGMGIAAELLEESEYIIKADEEDVMAAYLEGQGH